MEFIKNNWLSIISLMVGLIGIYLAFYFYEESQSSREPSFLSSESTELFSSNDAIGAKNFTIINNKTGEPVKSKIFTQEVIFWNSGKLSIRHNNILKPLEIKYPDNVEILESSIIESSRQEINDPKISISHSKKTIKIEFNILEQDDGIKIRTTYSGESPETPTIEGVIESTKTIKTNKDLESKNIIYGITKTIKTISIVVLLFIGFGLLSAIPDFLKRLFPETTSKIPKAIKRGASLAIPTAFILLILIGGGAVFYKSVIEHAKEGTLNNTPKMSPVK
ncbi:hypothetical protein D7243_12475 [Stutzerimonas stutzeri]|nr:hypothetical protein [Stutzerimonas stutzeri]